jgi:hypothetical protein
MKKEKVMITIISILFLSISLFFYFMFFGTPWGKIEQKKLMLSYLSDKYHEDFTIHQMINNPNGTGYYATASPKSKPNLRFDVSESADELSGYADLYPVVFWKTEDARPIKNYILDLFPDLDASRFTLDRKSDEEVGKYVPSLKSVHYDMGYSGVLTLYFHSDWFQKTESERNTELQKIQSLAEYLQKKNLPVLVRLFYGAEDYRHWKAIYITQKGKIVKSQ